MERLGEALAGLCRKHTRTYWILLLRRLHASDLYKSEFRQTALNVEVTAELAAMKYGQPGYADLFPNGEPPPLDSEPTVNEHQPLHSQHEKLRAWSVSPPVSEGDFYDLVAIQELSSKYYRLTAEYRRVGKGSRLLVKEGTEWEAIGSQELERLINVYDYRQDTSESDLLASLGLSYVINKESILPNLEQPMAFCLMGPQPPAQLSKELLSPVLGDDTVLMPAADIRYIPAFVDLSKVEKLIHFSKDDFANLHGLPWEAFSCFVSSIAWQNLLLLRQSTRALRMATLIRRGCMLTASLNVDSALRNDARVLQERFYPDRCDQGTWDSYIEAFLRLAEVRSELVNLHALRPQAFLLREGERMLVNYAAVIHFLVECLRLRVSDHAKNARAAIAESVMEDAISRRTGLQPCYPRNKKFRMGKNTLGEADLSFRVGTVYIPVDVKAYLVSVEFDRGDHNAVQGRWHYVTEWVEQAEELGQSLKSQPTGSNYDLLRDGLTHVLPIICSPFHEYIGDLDRKFWLDDTTPRVATPAEIVQFLTSHSEEQLKTHHLALRLDGNGE